jgi:hypothetical protein
MTSAHGGASPRNFDLARNPFGRRNVRLVKTAEETNRAPHRHDDGDLHLTFVDNVEGLVILAVDRPQAPTEMEPGPRDTTPKPITQPQG